MHTPTVKEPIGKPWSR